MFEFGERSLRNLEGVNPKLQQLAKEALQESKVDFLITEGLRTKERQKELVAKGLSNTMKSKHITGHAIDIVPYPIDWNDWGKFLEIYEVFKVASAKNGIKFRWGGDWNMNGTFKDERFMDGPHFELI